MKQRLHPIEIALMLAAALILTSGAVALHTQSELADKVVRLHVLANSDSAADQALKLKVRDSVLEAASAILEGCPDRETAEQRLFAALPEIEDAARARIAAEGETQALTAELRAALGPEVCILMLAHRNGDLTTWADLGVQAVLCGHGHGGLWRLPFLGGLFGPDRSLLPRFDAGVFREGRTAMVVSRGLGNSAPIPRLFNPAELPVVTLIPEKKERD